VFDVLPESRKLWACLLLGVSKKPEKLIKPRKPKKKKPNKKKPIKPIKFLKKPAGWVGFRFYKKKTY
jgi:hypothetical protein